MSSPHPFRTVRHDGVEICTQAFGDPARPAVLLIMGATASMLWWPDPFCAALSDEGVFVIRYDNRDTGQSTTGPAGAPGYSMDDMAGDALAVLDGYAIEAAHVAGMSLGGMIAQRVALEAPTRVLSLTAISSSAFDDDGEDLPPMDPAFGAHFAGLDAVDWRDRDAAIAYQVEAARLCANDDARFDRAEAADLAGREFDRARNPRSAFNHGQLEDGVDTPGRPEDIAVPALVIHGAKDPILALEAGRRLAARLPDATLLILDGGHELNRQDWPKILAAIRTLITRTPDRVRLQAGPG